MSRKIDILHIYAGTSGSSGLYIHSIFKALKYKYKQEAILSYNFPFNYGKKKFYRFSDLSKPNFLHMNQKFRLVVRYFELMYALIFSLVYIIIYKPKIINYSFTSQINLELYFLKLVRLFTRTKIWITAHDVIPFQTNYNKLHKSITQRGLFFKLAHRIIVHNKNAKNELIDKYNISKLRILSHPFPLMNLLELDFDVSQLSLKKFNLIRKEYFLFTGHLRSEKGLHILLAAWNKFLKTKKFTKKKLVIAGNMPSKIHLDLKNKNILFIDRFLKDNEYRFFIENALCVILPYTRGTNSGIPSSVISLKTKLITSDIEMFKNNQLIDKKFIFKSGNSLDLTKTIIKSTTMKYNFSLIDNYNKLFKNEILNIYEEGLQ